jgi:hypothetical protein
MSRPADTALCPHCERRPPAHPLGLCGRCAASPSIRLIYRRRRDWTPEWEAHLRRLAARARRKLPLFD